MKQKSIEREKLYRSETWLKIGEHVEIHQTRTFLSKTKSTWNANLRIWGPHVSIGRETQLAYYAFFMIWWYRMDLLLWMFSLFSVCFQTKKMTLPRQRWLYYGLAYTVLGFIIIPPDVDYLSSFLSLVSSRTTKHYLLKSSLLRNAYI